MKYFNNIKQEETDFKYRFKTESEFVKDFSRNWFDHITMGWTSEMNYLFGHDLELSEEESDRVFIEHEHGQIPRRQNINNVWLVEFDMIIPNRLSDF